MLRKQKIIFSLLLLILVSLPALKALAGSGFYTSHDGFEHLPRLAQYISALKEGQIPPRWAGTLVGRLGSPLFVYSYQLPYILGSLPYFAGFSLPASLKLVFGLSFVISGIGTFFWLKEYFSTKASFLGALFFLYAPYRFIMIYVRAVAGELLALAILPFILLFITRLIKTPNLKNVVWLGLSFGSSIIAHTLFLPMYLPIIFSYLIFAIIADQKSHPRYSLSRKITIPLLGLTLGIGLSAFSLFPVVFEGEYIAFDQFGSNLAECHLVELWQLIHSPWGYGFSHPGIIEDAMSFQVGLTQILVFFMSLALILLSSIPLKVTRSLFACIGKKINLAQFGGAILTIAWFTLAVFLMLNIEPTKWVWRTLPGISVIDIPWRFLGLTTLAASFLAAFVADGLKKPWLVVISLTLIVLFANRNHLRINQPVFFNDQHYQNDMGTTTFSNEYRPIWRSSNSTEPVKPRFYPLHYADKAKVIENTGTKLVAQADFPESTRVQLNILYFPGWHIYLQQGNQWQEQLVGKEVTIVNQAVANWKVSEVEGTMQVSIPAGP